MRRPSCRLRRELVQRHIEAGDLCCIVTATNVFITKPIGKALGFEQHLLGIDLGTAGGDPLARFTEPPSVCRLFAKARSRALRTGWLRSAIVCRISAELVL